MVTFNTKKSFATTCFSVMVLTSPSYAADLWKDDQQYLSVKIYQSGLAQIIEDRRFNEDTSLSKLKWNDLPRNILMDSLSIALPKGSITEIQHPRRLPEQADTMEQFIGQKLDWIQEGESAREAVLLAITNEGIWLQFDDKVELNPTGYPRFHSLPNFPKDITPFANLVLNDQITAEDDTDIRASYLTSGLGWKANYKAVLTEDMSQISLAGFVTVTNDTKRDFEANDLSLIAGDAKFQHRRPITQAAPMMKSTMSSPGAMEMDSAVSQPQAIADRQLFKLDGKRSIPASGEVRYSYLPEVTFPVQAEYLLEWSMPWGGETYIGNQPLERPQTIVKFENSKDNSLGKAMPQGNIRFYGSNTDLTDTIFVGEDHLPNAQKDQKLRFQLGQAFDISARHVQRETEPLSKDRNNFITTYDVIFKNSKNTDVELTLRDLMPGNVKVIESNTEYEQRSQRSVDWKISIPANSDYTLTYKVHVNG